MLIQILTILCIVIMTYVFLQVIGPRSSGIFLSIKERQRWSHAIGSKLGKWLYIANLSATLTSLATVYVFFIGTSSLFGFYIYVCIAAIVFGSFITTKLTSRLVNTEQFKTRMNSSDLTTVAVASLFWKADAAGRTSSFVARLITQVSILCILWLEFATFSMLAGGMFGIESMFARTALMFFAVLFVFDFTLRNGLRGFIFTDLLHAPIILFGTLLVAYGSILMVMADGTFSISPLFASPHLPMPEVITFAVATVFLNGFILLTSESHWIRVWSMREQISKSTYSGMLVTASIWIVLIMIGLIIVASVKGVGVPAVVALIKNLVGISPWFGAAFWAAAVAALFSTCDAQLYSFLLVSAFDSKTGNIQAESILAKWPAFSALVLASCFSAIYYTVTVWSVPFEPIVFFVFPLFLCLVPAMVQLIVSGKIKAWPMMVSVALYVACGGGMLLYPAQAFFFSLAAPLMPAGIAIIVLLRK